MVPEGWLRQRIGSAVKVQGGYAFPSEEFSDAGLPIVRISSIQNARVDLEAAPRFAEDTKLGRFLLRDKDILIAMSGATTGKIGRFKMAPEMTGAYLNQRVGRFTITDTAKMSYEFLWQYLAVEQVQNVVAVGAIGGAQPNISGGDIENIVALIPPLPEQQKIAEILSTWDMAIETTEALLANARCQKQALMQSLLTGTRRFPGFEDHPWREVRFDSVFERVKRKNTVGNTNVLTISGQDGLVSQNTYFNKRVASADLSGYTLLAGGDFAYNKSYSAGYPMGAIKVLHTGVTGVVSSLYLCFRLRPGSPHSLAFFRHYFEAGCFDEQIAAIAQEGARNHGLLNVSIPEFFETNVRIPSPPEQERIAVAIDLAEGEETATRETLEALRTEKKSLMQQLLTGKRRVVV